MTASWKFNIGWRLSKIEFSCYFSYPVIHALVHNCKVCALPASDCVMKYPQSNESHVLFGECTFSDESKTKENRIYDNWAHSISPNAIRFRPIILVPTLARPGCQCWLWSMENSSKSSLTTNNVIHLASERKHIRTLKCMRHFVEMLMWWQRFHHFPRSTEFSYFCVCHSDPFASLRLADSGADVGQQPMHIQNSSVMNCWRRMSKWKSAMAGEIMR